MAASCGESCPRGPIFPGRVTCLGCSLACWWRGLPPRSGETRWSPSWAPAVLVGDRILRVGEAALTVLDHETLAGRDVAIAYVHLIEHLEVGLPALRRDHMADIAALVIEEFDVRILGEERLERVVGIEAIPSSGDGRRHELNAQRRGVGIVKILLEFPGPVVVHVAGEHDQVREPGVLDRRQQTIACSHGTVPLVHACGQHVGIRVAVTTHDHHLLAEYRPARPGILEAVVEPALLRVAEHSAVRLQRLAAIGFHAVAARLVRAEEPRVEDVEADEITDSEAPIGEDIRPARYERPAHGHMLVPGLEGCRPAQQEELRRGVFLGMSPAQLLSTSWSS